jgi:hypothetical protein
MLERTLVVAALSLGATFALPDVSEAHRRYRGYPRYGAYPSFHLGYTPGYYPSFSIGSVGYGPYPFSVGFSFVGGPKDPRGVVRFQVYPKATEVYIDGYYAGIVGDFGKLRLEPGPHDITLYLDGHRTFEETVYSTAGSTVRIHHEMEPLAPGEPAPLRPSSPGGGTRAAPAPSSRPQPPPPSSMTTSPSSTTSSEYGELVLRSQPSEPEVWIDGELWHFSGGGERLTVHLPAGSYELQLRKEGFEPFVTRVDVFPRETTALNVRLGATPR